MLLDMGWSELMLIGIVALVVIGPKDLVVLEPDLLAHPLNWVKSRASTLAVSRRMS